MPSVLCEEACGIHSFRPQNKLINNETTTYSFNKEFKNNTEENIANTLTV
jgi:hypothetical protein